MDWFTSPTGAFVNFIIALVGLGLAIVFYYRSKRDKEPCWSIQTVNLFEDYTGTVEGLEIQYQGEKVRDISISKLAFWNRGALTIDQADFTDADPLRIELKGKGRILSAMVLQTNNMATKPLVSKVGEDRALVRFDYLDRNQGFVVQVIHEGRDSADLEIKGSIKGCEKVSEVPFAEARDNDLGWVEKHGDRVLLPIAALGTVAGVAVVEGIRIPLNPDGGIKFILTMCAVALLVGVVSFGLYVRIRSYLVTRLHQSTQVPYGLEKFVSDPRESIQSKDTSLRPKI